MIYDISPPLTTTTGVWPGDTPLSREVLSDMREGDNLTLSTLRTTVHIGAHADGPNHYGADAPAIDQRSLDNYLGPCQVIRVKAQPATRIGFETLGVPIESERILLATGTFADFKTFNEDFAALEPALVDRLAGLGVKLIGIDTPSVDLFDSKELPSHAAFLRHDMAILEGLFLDKVPPGRYELIALPLKLVGFDASPVRAILRG